MNEKQNKKPSQVVIDLDKALDDIINQYISVMLRVKKLCPKDFTDNQIDLIFVRSESTYTALLLKFYKDQMRKQKSTSNEENDVSII